MRKTIAVAWLAGISTVSFAHHSFNATFDPARVIEIEGEVTKVRWLNPHVRFTVRVPGDEVVFDPRVERRWADQSVESNAYWVAPTAQGANENTGIFRVWSTVLSDPASFPLMPQGFVPTFDVNSYPLTQAARSALTAFDPLTDTPTLNCAPKGMPTIMEQPYPIEFVAQDNTILLRLEEYDTVRTIHLDSSVNAAEQILSLLGYSVGRWEDGTLVVTTTRSSWEHFDTVGIPLSADSEITEWFTPADNGSRLNYRLRISDPVTFTEPVVLEKYWLAVNGVTVQPYSCTN